MIIIIKRTHCKSISICIGWLVATKYDEVQPTFSCLFSGSICILHKQCVGYKAYIIAIEFAVDLNIAIIVYSEKILKEKSQDNTVVDHIL